MKKGIKIAALLLCAVLLLPLLAGCMNDGNESKKIGIFMPSKNEPRWVQDSDSLMRQLQNKEYRVETRNAEDDVDLQIRQIDEMIDSGCDILVIAPIDGPKLKDVLQKAADKKITVIAYDRLIMDSPNVDYYVTFDNFEVGRLQGAYLEKALDLPNSGGPFHIEIFAGSPTDNNAVFFYDGAMSVLRPYIDSGKLIVLSGEVERAETAIHDWLPSVAKERITRLLDTYYADGTQLHAVLSPNDVLALGIIDALKAFGFGADGKPFPLITGQDSDKENIVAILRGEQTMTVFKDTRTLADRTFRMVDDILLKKPVETNDSKTYHNNINIVPTYICKPVLVDKNNYKNILVDSGYYEMSDFAE
ncbi:MAG: sugar-binding protein [Clostridia bacterium]|nr:sugar-binding protein [Clostridia bacterium]